MLPLENAPFILGVTGHMDIRKEEEGKLKERMEVLLRFLLSQKKPQDAEPLAKQMIALLEPVDSQERNPHEFEAYERTLSEWPKLEKTRLLVLTSLAPGADTLAAEVALDLKASGLSIDIIAALPMHYDLYDSASTFKDNNVGTRSEKQQRYHELLEKIGRENTFCVRMASDVDLSADAFKAKCKEDRDADDPAARRARYRAAGEYISEYSHLLLAIWDSDQDFKSDEGTAAIVHARRGTLQYGLLPSNDGLNLPHGGPIFQLFTHRVRNANERRLHPAARFLHCYAAEAQEHATSDAEKEKGRLARLHFRELSLFSRIVRHLEDFNRLPAPTDEVQKEMDAFLAIKNGDASRNLETVLGTGADTGLFDRFRAFATLRKRTSKAITPLSSGRNRTLVALFWLTLIAAALGHLYVEWHPQKPKNEITKVDSKTHGDNKGAAEGHGEFTKSSAAEAAEPSQMSSEAHPTKPDAPNTSDSNPAASTKGESNHDHHAKDHKHDPRRFWWGISACGIALGAIGLFAWQRSKHSIERAHDYRAIAEGMRVQGFWNLAGLGKSVPANYMQRQRGELDWLRGVTRAVSMPYDFWREQMERQSLETQALAMRCVYQNWVCQQERYFKDNTRKKLFELHSWHKLGTILALAGLVGTIVSVFSAFFDSHEPLHWLKDRWWIGVLFTLLFLTATAIDAAVRWNEQRANILEAHHHPPKLNFNPWSPLSWLRIGVFHLLELAIVTTHAQSTEYLPPEKERWRMLRNGLTYLLPAAALAFLAMTKAALISIYWNTSPDVTVWTSISLGVYLIGGAMCIAWTEKQLDSEFAYQFGTMAPLFLAARLRLEPLVSQLEAYASSNNMPEFEKTRQEIRDVYYELGLEALDENAEWLLLHRARPLEPVMAG